ncbi:Gamma-aminobutyric acid type B receptor subunit 2, partial [Tyrophagus putrescentiae]
MWQRNSNGTISAAEKSKRGSLAADTAIIARTRSLGAKRKVAKLYDCDAGYGMKAFFGMLDEQPVKIILFGDACSVVTDPIAKAIKFFHLIQLSYADTFTATTANFFRIVPSEESFNPARVKLLKHYNWTHVGTIYQNTPRNSL